MKRNLLNVAMFGLLAAAVPASTFVSCKDYDEDFSQIKGTMKSDKQALMDADAAIQKQVTALEGKLATVNETLDNLKKQQGTNTEGIKKNAEVIKACAEDIAKLKTAVDAYKKTQDEIRAAVEKLQNDKLDASELVKINAGIKAAADAADAANGAAGKAQAAADAAKAAADAANGAAGKAQATADAANGAAGKAQATADANAKELKAVAEKLKEIDAVKKTADEALKQANKAVADAAAAAQAAQVADGKASAAQTALDAYKIEAEKKFQAQTTMLNNYKAELDKLVAKDGELATAIQTEKDRVDALTTQLAEVKKTADAAQTAEQVAAAVDVAIQKITALEKQVQANVNVMEIVGKLKSMELETEFSYNGLEAIETASYQLTKLAPANPADANKVNYGRAHVDNARSFPTQSPLGNYIPATYAIYNLNPSTAKVVANKDNFKFLGLNQVMQVRGTNGFEAPAVKSVTVANGQARVELDLAKRGTIKTGTAAGGAGGIVTREHVSTIALRYMVGDTAVTSSYAALVANSYDQLALYQLGESDNLAFDFSGRALAHTLSTSYKEPLELGKVIATRRVDGAEQLFWDENAAQENNPVVAAGFKYQFDLVKENASDENYKYFTLDRNTGRLTPTDINGNEDKQAAVDRVAHVRVSLVKGTDVVAVGYFDVKVTGEVIERAVNNIDKPYTLSCDDDAKVLNKADRFFGGVINEVALATGYTQAQVLTDVKTKFTFEMDGASLATYTKTPAGWTKDATPKFEINVKGSITATTFSVSVKQAVADAMKATGDEVSTYVKMSNPQNITAYFKIVWRPSVVHNAPAVDYAAEHKPIKEFYEFGDRREFRVNTGQVNKYDFSYDFTEGFVGNNVAITFKDPSPYATVLAGNIKNDRFVFVEPTTRYVMGASGATYVIKVSAADPTILTADKVDPDTKAEDGNPKNVAQLVGNKIKFIAEEYPQDILNKYSRDEMEDGQTFTAYIKRVADYCAVGKAIKVTNNQFAVRFIRPINIKAATVEVIDDAKQPVQEIPAVINFTDWRNVNFDAEPKLYEDATGKGYHIKSIVAEPKSEWTTDLDGGTLGSTSLTDKTSLLKLEWVAPTGTIGAASCGKVKYTASNAVTKEFKVRIPLVVTYRWGKIRTHIDVTIKPTVK